jgi:hypothetical protein
MAAHRDAKTGRFARRPVADVASTSEFNPMGSDIPFEDVSGTPSPSTTTQPRYAPQADELGQLDAHSPLRSRNPVMVHPADEGHHNAIMRTAARSAGPMDPTPFLTGLGSPVPPSRGIQGSRVEVHGDQNTLSPGRVMPPRTRPRYITDDSAGNLAEVQRRMDDGLFSSDASNALRPASRGQGRGRDR